MVNDRISKPLSRQLDLNLLELFDNVYRTRNLTVTAGLLGLSQPAVSRGLGRLREMYDDVLFVRHQRGVNSTPFADGLAEPIAAALAIVRGTVERPTFDPAIDQRAFTIAMSDIGERHFLPQLLGHVARSAPGVTIEIASLPRVELIAGLASGEVDLVAGFLPDLGKQVHQRRLFRERFVYLARKGHPTLGPALTLAQLRGLPHVLASPPGTPHAHAVEMVLTSRRVRAPIALRVRSFLSVGPIVAKTDLVAAVPSNLANLVAEHLSLQMYQSPMEIPAFDVSMAWHQRFHRDPAIEWLRGAFEGLFAGKKLASGT